MSDKKTKTIDQIDQLEQLRERVQELERTLLATENAPAPIIQINLKFEVVYANPKGRGLLEVLQKSDVFDTLEEKSRDSFAANEEVLKEYVINDRLYECRINPIVDKGLINWYFYDITDRKLSENALRKSEYRYRKIIETASDIVYRSSPDGFFKYANPIAVRMMKYPYNELINKKFTDLILPEYVEQAEAFYRKQFQERIGHTYYEFPARAKDGQVYWIGQHVQAIINNDKIIEFLAVARDITDKKKAEQELIIAREKAEESARAKEQFLANISHEMRTPLNVIIGMSNLLNEALLNDEQKSYLKAIQSSSSNLLVIINDLLDLTKLGMGGVQLEQIEFSLNEIITMVVASHSLKAKEKGLEIKCAVDPKVNDQLVGDPTKLNQVLLNLVGNAVKFTQDGHVALTVSLLERDKSSNTLEFQIADTGIGIDKGNQEKIFDAFTQEDASVTRKFGGTGLGLAISKNIVEQFGGELQLESEKGKGSRFSFRITFPIANGAEMSSFGIIEEPNLSNINVLIAEDNTFNQMLIKAIFNKNRIKFKIVSNGLEVVQELQDKREVYNLILLDMQMPEMGGEETVKVVREKINNHIPIIALTATKGINDREKYLSLGLTEYLSKPFKEQDLLKLLVQVVSK